MEALTIIFDGVIIFQRTLYESQFELLKVNWLSFSILSILSRIHLSIIIFPPFKTILVYTDWTAMIGLIKSVHYNRFGLYILPV